jgi:Mg-chelatase subunit ChlD
MLSEVIVTETHMRHVVVAMIAALAVSSAPAPTRGSSQQNRGSSSPVVEILHPRNGAVIRQQQPRILLEGRVTPPASRATSLDVFFVIDVSGSTRKYAGLNFLTGLSVAEQRSSFITNTSDYSETDNSILGAAVGATRRLLTQLDPRTTRVGIITFDGTAKLIEPLTNHFGWLHLQLKEILRAGPHGGTQLADALRMGIRELAGLGVSKPRRDSTKIQMVLTDGYPTLPAGHGRAATQSDIDVAIKAARIARKAGIKVNVFGLGQAAPERPRAAVEIASATGGTYIAVTSPEDIFDALEESSTVGVTHVEIRNETTGETATEVTLGSGGSFTSVVPVRTGRNRIRVRAHAGQRAATAYLVVNFAATDQPSLELDVFLRHQRQQVLQQLTR